VAPRRRPDFTLAVTLLIEHVSRTMPQFAHVVASQVLVVCGEARRASRGTVKPLAFRGGKRVDALGRRKPTVRVSGRRILYAITLRPLFFRRSTPRERVATILHELFHISPAFDGTLYKRRRHASAGSRFDRLLKPLERRYWKLCPAELKAAFAYDGEVRIKQWLEKPQSWLPGERTTHRRLYTEKHLFEGIVRMKTARTRRAHAGTESGATPKV
jgi:hypothetical protein